MQIEAEFLSRQEVRRIHEGALEVLAGTGVQMGLPQAWEILESGGARVERGGGLVRFPRDMVEKAVAMAPGSFRLYGRDPKHDLDIPGGGPYFGTWVNSVRVLDLETGDRRSATLRDLEQYLSLVDALENFAWIQPLLSPQDVPQDKVYYYAWAAALNSTRKHLIGPAPGAQGVQTVLELCSVVAGGSAQLAERPFISLDILTRPPLTWSDWSLGALIEAAKCRIPVYLQSGPIAGATGPVTMAGTLVQAHAELLAGITLSQLTNPGTPVFYASAARVMDMRTGSVSLCSPEWFLFRICLRQLARELGLPVHTGGLFTDAKIPDAQSGYEKGISALAGALGGDIISGCTLETNKCVDMGDLVIGDEIASFVRRLMRGFVIDDETLALEEIAQVGPGGEYLSRPHTLKHFRREIWQPALSDRSSWGDWEAMGKKDLWQRAKEKAREILAKHEPPRLPDDQWREICRIVEKAPAISGH